MKTNKHFSLYIAQFLLEWETFQTKVLEKIKIFIVCSITFFRESCRLWNNVEKYRRAGQTTDYTKTHSHWMLDTKGYRRILRICNIYCFSTSTMVARTRYNVTVHLYVEYGLVLRRFFLMKIHFYDPCPVGPNTRDLWCITVWTQLYLVCFRSFPVCMCFFFFYFSAVLLSWLWFSHPWRPSKRQKRRKNQNSWRYILSWCPLNHFLVLLQQNKKWFDWYFFNYLCYFLDT